MAILEGRHIVPPPRTQATSRSPAPLGLTSVDKRIIIIKKKKHDVIVSFIVNKIHS